MTEWISSLDASLGVYLATLVVCFISGFVPLVNAEIYLVSMAALTPTSALVPLALLAMAGQMGAKVMLYYAGQGVIQLKVLDRARPRMESLRGKLEGAPRRVDLFMLGSASLGLPPFYVVSILAGAARVHLGRFIAVGSLGRFLRFSFTLGIPYLLKAWLF
jgi:membrane protein YqaA with SNARE-associated domain